MTTETVLEIAGIFNKTLEFGRGFTKEIMWLAWFS